MRERVPMAAANEMARVKREIEVLGETIEAALRAGAKGLTPTQRQLLRSEIEHCAQRLDELRNRLSG